MSVVFSPIVWYNLLLMAGEKLTGIDQGTLLAERMLGSGEVLRGLIAGGQDKEVILRQVVSDLGNDPVGQAIFLRILLRNISMEGDATVTDRRDGARAVLTDATITPLVEANRAVVIDAYIEAVQQQTRDNDLFSGSVDALLEVGKALAPIFHQARGRGRKKESIITAWEELAQQFPAEDQFHIRTELRKIEEAMSYDKPRKPRASKGKPVIKVGTNLDIVKRKRFPSVIFEAEQRAGLRSLIKVLGFTQQDLCLQIGIAQSWISNLLRGVTPVRDLQKVGVLVNELRQTLKQRLYRGQRTSSEVVANRLLDGILAKIGVDYRSPLTEPLGSIPVDAKNYLHRPEETAIRRVLNHDAGNYRFSLVVTGPPDSGKFSLVNLLGDVAYLEGVDVNSIDFRIFAESSVDEKTEESLVVDYMVKSLAATGLHSAVPASDDIKTFSDISIWYGRAIQQARPGDKRLFLFTGLDSLRHEGVKARFLYLLENLRFWQSTLEAGSAFVTVVTPETLALHRVIEGTGSMPIQVGWFDLEQVKKLTAVLEIPNAEQLSNELFESYGGQPALTHVAAMLIRDNPELTSDRIYQMALAGEGQFWGHVDRIRRLIHWGGNVHSCLKQELNSLGLSFSRYISGELEIDLSTLNIYREQLDYLLGLGLFMIKEEDGKRLLKPRTKFYRDLILSL